MKNKITKKVNIVANRPIFVSRIPIRGTIRNTVLDIETILKIICQKGIIDEVLEDGTLVRLDLTNYNKDNSHRSKTAIKQAAEKAKKEAEEAAELIRKAKEAEELAKQKAKEEALLKQAEERARLEAEKKAAEEQARREAAVAEKRAAIERAKAEKAAKKAEQEQQKVEEEQK